MEHIQPPGQKAKQRRLLTCLCQLNRKSADFLKSIRIHSGPKNVGNQLCTQAYSNHNLPLPYSSFNHSFSAHQPGESIFVVDSYLAAHDNKPVNAVHLRQRIIPIKLGGCSDDTGVHVSAVQCSLIPQMAHAIDS